MEITKQNIVQLTFIDDEAVLFCNILEKIASKYTKEAGFKKLFNLDESQMLNDIIDRMYEEVKI